MARSIAVCGAMLFGAGLSVVTGAATARAQMSSDPAEITTCLCMQQGVAALSGDMSAKTQALAAVRQHLADLDAQLAQARPNVDVNNADSVARYKALLQQRDAAYQQSLGGRIQRGTGDRPLQQPRRAIQSAMRQPPVQC